MTIVEKFLDYVSYHTTSDEESETCPSTARQLELAKHLKDELIKLNLEDVYMSDKGYVYGTLKGNAVGPRIGLVAHMDTSPAASGENVKPRIIENYDGKDITLSDGIVTTVKRFPDMARFKDKTIIVTDGHTLLGADDKAGIAIIMDTIEFLINNPKRKHSDIVVAFTPDEEVGRGTENFDYERFKCDYAYTLDGDDITHFEYECFNAASAVVEIKGISVHPGDAKDRMINAINVAHTFHDYLPERMRPENTSGYEGFNHLDSIEGDISHCKLNYILRNHDINELNEQKELFIRSEHSINEALGGNYVKVTLKDGYRNMKDAFKDKMQSVDIAIAAAEKAGINLEIVPIRGGTDGSAISWRGIPCPNFGTGGANYHGVHEVACVDEMKKMVEILIILFDLAAD